MKISKVNILSFVLALSQLGFIFTYVIPNQQIVITKTDPSSEIPLRVRVKSSQIEFQKITEPFNNHTNNNNFYLYKQINGSVYLIVSADNGHLIIVDYLDSNKSQKLDKPKKKEYNLLKKRSIGNHMLEYFTPNDDLTFSGSPGKFISEPVSFEVKVLIVTDETILEHFSKDSADKSTAFSNMRIYYTELINSVNNLFKSDSKTKISIKIADFLFLEFINDLYWLANFIVGDSTPFYNGKEVINSKKALHAFKHYMSKLNLDVDYNLAIGFTKKDLWYDSKTETEAVKSTLSGISYFGSLCSNYKYLIVEDDGQLSNKFTLARQILHSMGVNYDTDSCGNGYLMNKFLTQNNPVLSSCSKQQIKMNFLENGETLSEMAGCLSYSLETEQSMFGQFWNANEQCKLIFGPSASFCHEYSSQICSALYCRQSVSSKTCMAYSPAANGTVCGFRKMCLNGMCKSSWSAPALECPFGDDFVQNGIDGTKFNDDLITCSEYFDEIRKFDYSIDGFCNTNSGKVSCCQSCLKYRALNCADKNVICPAFTDYCGFLPWIRDLCPRTCKKCQVTPIFCTQNDALCNNGGTCINVALDEKKMFGFSCKCKEGFSGEFCEKKNPCQPNPCKNEGLCLIIGSDGYKCECPDVTGGNNCELLFTTKFEGTTLITEISTTEALQENPTTEKFKTTSLEDTSTSTETTVVSSLPDTTISESSSSISSIKGTSSLEDTSTSTETTVVSSSTESTVISSSTESTVVSSLPDTTISESSSSISSLKGTSSLEDTFTSTESTVVSTLPDTTISESSFSISSTKGTFTIEDTSTSSESTVVSSLPDSTLSDSTVSSELFDGITRSTFEPTFSGSTQSTFVSAQTYSLYDSTFQVEPTVCLNFSSVTADISTTSN